MSALRKRVFLTFFLIIIISRIIYTIIGIVSRSTFLDKSQPFPSWTYNSKIEAINVWTVWDSGFYHWIATLGYPDNKDTVKQTTLKIPAGSWLKVFLGYGQVGKDRFELKSDPVTKINNTLFAIGSETKDTTIDLYAVYPGIPYCLYKGPIDFDTDVASARGALTDPKACGDASCDVSYLTYYSAPESRVVYQEHFNKDSVSPLKTLGGVRPAGFDADAYQGLGCKTIEEKDIVNAPKVDYSAAVSPYPFMPLYPYLSKVLSLVGMDVVLGGLVLSLLCFFLSAVYFYKFLKFDFDEKFAFLVVLVYLLYPFNFILTGFLTEGLFNFLLFATLYYARKGNFVLGSAFGALLSISRITGVFILLPLMLIYKRSLKGSKFYLACGLSLVTVPVLFTAHLWHLYTLTNDWLVIVHAQNAWGRVGGSILSTLISYLSFSTRVIDFEFFTFALVLGLTIYALTKIQTKSGTRLPIEYFIYSVYAIGIPFASGTLTSFPRYSLGIFPIFIGLAYIAKKLNFIRGYLILSFILSCLLMAVWVLSTKFIV